ncbi:MULTISPECIES: helix-turn-helix domain-containing protein [unclassified Paenibacillus]|uniref:winged helix-turn-helix transcriptional regulator n=1 Tax=unclassified Paenibacillus TaxID=185978 RepID=UPI0027852E6A|nr:MULTISPECIES: helix-turn-helix domain-containing protein [unclassified Paenibacillus]MDQ0899154.1 DNA-binding HxlR family transcriptional regulator [Paenibacillus sp. V4I7]MDQ0914862.1 DNA-binding HxlR family transcriptional regulator [Paenibacillus sp. V4I5]
MPYQDESFGCPVEVGLQMISGKWKPKIMYELLQQTRRFGELLRLIPGVSRHVMTIQLRLLEEDGIVKRTAYLTIPPKVEYELTEFGRSLEPILIQLLKVGEHSISLRKNERNES